MMTEQQYQKLTAYLLGELPAAEAKEIKAWIETDAEARAEAEALRVLMGVVEQEFQKEEPAHLSQEQKQKLQTTLEPPVSNVVPLRSRPSWRQVFNIAASTLLVAGLAMYVNRQRVGQADLQGRMDASTSGEVVVALNDQESDAQLPEAQPHLMKTVSSTSGVKDKKEVGLDEETLFAKADSPAPYPAKGKPSSPLVIGGSVGSGGLGFGIVGDDATSLPAEAPEGFNTEAYDFIAENTFLKVDQNPLSTFSIDVDTASYANLRRFLNSHRLPPKDAVRIEEMVNYFTYRDAPPADAKPFAIHTEVATSPWKSEHRLVRVGIKGKELGSETRPSNLVFLIDVSGSMFGEGRLPLLKQSLKLLVETMSEQDRLAIVTYAGSSGLALPSTSGEKKAEIFAAIDRLEAGGSTNGGAGIELAYKMASEHFIKGGVNRVVLGTDGDFNVGTTGQGDLTRLIEEKAKSGVFLSVLGFGMGNYKDSTMEKLADKGNGNYAYIDSEREAKKVLVDQKGGTLVTIAKDVKIQVEFNPAKVQAYRLIGYENRKLKNEDFNNDKIDAGEIGAGHTVTALYEIVPSGVAINVPGVDPLKYQSVPKVAAVTNDSPELLTVKVRFKKPDGDTSESVQSPLIDAGHSLAQSSNDLRFAASVAGFGMLLRDSQFKGDLTYEKILDLASGSLGDDSEGYRKEFLGLVQKAKALPK